MSEGRRLPILPISDRSNALSTRRRRSRRGVSGYGLELSAAVLALEECLGLGCGVPALSFSIVSVCLNPKSDEVRRRFKEEGGGLRVEAESRQSVPDTCGFKNTLRLARFVIRPEYGGVGSSSSVVESRYAGASNKVQSKCLYSLL